MAGERIDLKGLGNTRDLGGYRTADGGILRPKRIIRSGALAPASKEDLALLTGVYELKTIIDFRTPTECMQKPDPQLEGVTYITNSILNEAQMGITHEGEQRPADLVDAMIAMVQEVGDHAEHYLADLYPVLVTDEHCLNGYRSFFEVLLSQESGSTLYHCSEGKDRVGTGTALLLSALGVDRDTIIEDYLLTNRYSEEKRKGILAMIRERVPGDELLHRRFVTLNSVHESYLASVFTTVENVYGSMGQFLSEKLGLDAENLERLKELYLE